MYLFINFLVIRNSKAPSSCAKQANKRRFSKIRLIWTKTGVFTLRYMNTSMARFKYEDHYELYISDVVAEPNILDFEASHLGLY